MTFSRHVIYLFLHGRQVNINASLQQNIRRPLVVISFRSASKAISANRGHVSGCMFCSIEPDNTAEKFVVNVSHLKQGLNFNDYRREIGRTVRVYMMLNTPFWNNFSRAYYEQLWDGSDQVTVSVRSLKEGFKSLEQNYYAPAATGSPSFRDMYAKTYGHPAWDERVKLLDSAEVKSEVYLMKLRKDLSSQ